jgi:LysM domain
VPATHPHQPTRLPTQSRGSKRAGEVVRGLVGLLATLIVVVGLPAALVLLVGNPLPDEAPNGDWLTAEISTDTLLAILAIVLWLAWLHFVICLLVELVSDRRGRGLAPHVPGGGVGTQALARRLVSAVLLLAGTSAATLPAATASSDRAPDPAPGASGTSLTTVAAQQGGDRVPQAADRVAEGVVKYYEVQLPSGRHYDTLWDIAERFLGSGLRYKEIFELNHGVLQPDGRKLTNADLIQPGWLLQLPGDAEGAGLKVVDHRVSHQSAPAPGVDNTEESAESETPREEPVREEPSDDAESGAPSESEARIEADEFDPVVVDEDDRIENDAAETETPEEDTSASGADENVWAPTFGVAGGLLAAGILVALRRRRLAGSQLFLRAPSPDGGPTGPQGLTIADRESDLRWESDPTAADLLSRGLRAWPPALYGGPVPQPTHCLVTPDGVSAAFADPPNVAVPPPWRLSGDGRVWTLRHDDHRRLYGGPPALVPFPGLVAFGRLADESVLYMDLEAFPGAISIGGDADVARSIAMSWAVDLAVHAWADERRVWLVGFADAPAEIGGPAMRVVDDVDRVLESLERATQRQRAACQRLGVETVAAGRVAEPDARMWGSDLVVLSGTPSEDTLSRLQELASRPDHAVAVVIVGDTPQAAARLAASSEGRLWSGPLGIDVTAQRLDVEAYRGLVDVFADADRTNAESADGLGGVTAPELDGSVFDPNSRQPVEIGILGPVAVEADGPVEEARRGLLTELVVYVALHPEGVHPNALTAALWPRGVSDDVVDSTLAAAQTWLGEDTDGTPRLAMVDGRWTVRRSGVRFDWDLFKALVNAHEEHGADEVAVLSQALGLVRGEPWSELPARSYGWLAYDTVDDDARVAVVLAARRLAAVNAERGDGRGARDAILRGLQVAPAAEDLWQDALRLAAKLGSRGNVRAVADEMYTAIETHGSAAGATAGTDALVEELIPGYRRHSAA